MIYPYANQPVSITIYKGVPFNNKYESHPFHPNFKISNTDVTSLSMADILDMKKDSTNRYFPKYTFSTETFNFNFANGLITGVTLEVPVDFCDANYMKVKTTNSSIHEPSRTYYYFITGVRQKNASSTGVTCELELEVDVLATYQDEIMSGLKGVPVNTERKHSHRYTQGTTKPKPYCCDLVNDEPVFSGLKPNTITANKKQYEVLITSNATEVVNACKNTLWAYIQYQTSDEIMLVLNDNVQGIKGLPQVTNTLAIPLVDSLIVNDTHSHSYTIYPKKELIALFDNPDVYGIKISPFPPFTTLKYSPVRDSDVTQFKKETYTNLIGDTCEKITITLDVDFSSSDVFVKFGNTFALRPTNTFTKGFMIITQYSTEYSLGSKDILDDFATSFPTKTTTRDKTYEPKLYVSPCRKYIIKTTACEGKEIFTQLVYGNVALASTTTYISVKAIHTINVQDLTLSFYPNFSLPASRNSTYDFLQDANIGLSLSPNYTLPVGKDALKYFNQTQGEQFTTQKVMTGIAGVLAIVGGVALLGKTGGFSAQAIKAGVMALGGAMSTAGAIASATAKYSDLANTPDEVSGQGSTIYHDFSILDNILPYLMVYKITPSEEEMLLDYFYDYGYNTQRCCYFNEELIDSNYAVQGYVDNNLFTRQTFNYIKLGEDISTKIHSSDIPPVVKNKIANIFQTGIKLYTFIGFEDDIKNTSGYANFYDYYDNNKYENPEVTA